MGPAPYRFTLVMTAVPQPGGRPELRTTIMPPYVGSSGSWKPFSQEVHRGVESILQDRQCADELIYPYLPDMDMTDDLRKLYEDFRTGGLLGTMGTTPFNHLCRLLWDAASSPKEFRESNAAWPVRGLLKDMGTRVDLSYEMHSAIVLVSGGSGVYAQGCRVLRHFSLTRALDEGEDGTAAQAVTLVPDLRDCAVTESMGEMDLWEPEVWSRGGNLLDEGPGASALATEILLLALRTAIENAEAWATNSPVEETSVQAGDVINNKR
jgi:hypothetical protein